MAPLRHQISYTKTTTNEKFASQSTGKPASGKQFTQLFFLDKREGSCLLGHQYRDDSNAFMGRRL
jgi:hypothetical protein